MDNRFLWPLGITAGISWAAWIYFLFLFEVGSIAAPAHPWRIVAYLLLVLAPALTFIPVALRLNWPLFAPYAVVAWVAFGYLLAFLPPPQALVSQATREPLSPESVLRMWYVFPVFFLVLTTILAPLSYAIGRRLFVSRTHQRDRGRAWREAILLSLYAVGLLIGRTLGFLTWPIALLSLLFLALVEALFLARKG